MSSFDGGSAQPYLHRSRQTRKKCVHTFTPRAAFKHTIPIFMGSKRVRASDHVVRVPDIATKPSLAADLENI